MEKYYVNFFDAFDGWGEIGLFKERLFNELKDAQQLCDKLQEGLLIDSKKMGEHYGVFDTSTQQEIYCKMHDYEHSVRPSSKQERLKKLLSALALGYRLYRLSHNDPGCKEELFIEYWKDGSALRSFGWGSAFGLPIDRVRCILDNPEDWHVGELNAA